MKCVTAQYHGPQVSFWLCDRADDGGGGEDGSVPVGLGRHRSIGHSTDPVSSTPAVCPSLHHHHEATPSHQCSAVWPGWASYHLASYQVDLLHFHSI